MRNLRPCTRDKKYFRQPIFLRPFLHIGSPQHLLSAAKLSTRFCQSRETGLTLFARPSTPPD
jgi:hypothetical protein